MRLPMKVQGVVLEYTENEMIEPELEYLSKQDICSLRIRFTFRFRVGRHDNCIIRFRFRGLY